MSFFDGRLAGLGYYCSMGNFADRLRELREKAGLTQAELAAAAGLFHSAISKLEQSSNEPSWATVQALAKALEVNVAAFETVAGKAVPAKRGRPANKSTSTKKRKMK